MKFNWTERAYRSLSTIEQYVSDVAGEDVAKKLSNRLLKKAKNLINFPHLGRAVPQLVDPHIRQVLEGSYRIIYELDSVENPSQIYIMGVVHSAQLLENTLLSDLLNE